MRRLINRQPSRAAAAVLAALPFALLIALYLAASDARLAVNPDDKLLPSPATIMDAIGRMAFEPDQRSGDILFWRDTAASLSRLLLGLGIAAATALALGTAIGTIPHVQATLGPLVAVVAMIPPLAVLPILFITLGLGEVAKVALIVIGVTPVMVRDLAFRVGEIPKELILKAQTLGASTWQLVIRVVVPMLLPQLVRALRLALGPAWLFLIAAEAIASTEGLGYRIFLVRRFLAMDVILHYVAWITLLAFAMDWALSRLSRRLFAWAESR
jgi:NitT/TauT family transport system permease protein